MKNLFHIIFIMLIAANFTIAQTAKITISGKVINKSAQEVMSFVDIILTNPIDNSFVSGKNTDANGQFYMEVMPGTYHITYKFLGYKDLMIKNVSMLKAYTVQTVEMVEDIEQLGTIEIIAERTTVTYELDKKIYHVGQDLISGGGSVQDVLGNVPSVTINNEGAVSLRGNSNVKILINGKPSVLSANGGLESIPAEDIASVEISTNPSAKYDADGTAGIVNIILKKNKRSGFSSSIQLNGAIPANNGINLNTSYKTKKFNLFSNFSYKKQVFIGSGSYYQTNTLSEMVDILDETYDINNTRSRFNVYIGSDYYIDSLNTLTLSFYHRNNVSNNTVNYNYDFINQDDVKHRNITAVEKYKEPQKASNIELNYVKEFKQKGEKFTANIQYDFWNDDENEDIVEHQTYPDAHPLNVLRSRDIESSQDVLFQSDYSKPIFEKSNFSIGIKGEIRSINSDYKVWTNEILIDSLDNLLEYDEGIYGAYLQYGNREHKFQYTLGLRVEHANTQSKDRKNLYKTDKNYTDLFPTVHLTYKMTDDVNIQLSYSRRISRPRFYQLNPFGGIADRKFIRYGNPDLDPMYTNSLELGTVYSVGKLTLNPSIYYARTINNFERITRRVGDYIATIPINLGTEDRYGVELIAQYSPAKWLRLTGEVNYYGYQQDGTYDNINYATKDKTMTSRLRSRFRFDNFILEASANYRARNRSGQSDVEPQWWVDMGLSKELFNDKATIGVSVNNVFNTREYIRTITGASYTILNTEKWYIRRINASFKYRFNRKSNERDRRH